MDKNVVSYTTGQFAKKANITIRTIRYYDKQGILKPSYVNESGYRLYTDEDFAKLQKILVLKYLGFSLEEIRLMTIHDKIEDILQSLQLQIQLIRKKREHLEEVENAICEAKDWIQQTNKIDWNEILKVIHLTNLEKTLIDQYKTAKNIEVRIQLHKKYSKNSQDWFSWLYSLLPLQVGNQILEIGCGNGELWKHAKRNEIAGKEIYITDLSKGMVEDAKSNLEYLAIEQFHFMVQSAQKLGFIDHSIDLMIANHVMFYIKDFQETLKEFIRVLKPSGYFFCSTYGKNHMKEITQLVKEFDSRITLSEVILFEQFGLENGMDLLRPYFKEVQMQKYEDELWVDEVEPLLDYILSCHGNQKELLRDHLEEFKIFLEEKIKRVGGIRITKEAGVFISR